MSIFSVENPLLRAYLFYTSILVLKMFVMALLTAVQRFKNKAFANPEDAKGMKVKPRVDDNVERVRRAHLNDLENIVPFFIVSFAYICTNPSYSFAVMLFRVFTVCRFVHTFVYAIVVVPQPARALAFFGGLGVTIYMAVQNVLYFR